MAAYNKYEIFTEDFVRGVHDFDLHVFKCALSNTAPNAGTHALRSQITELTTGGGYTQNAAGNASSLTFSRTGGVMKVIAADVVFLAAAGTIGPFRYTPFYNDTPSSPLDPLISWFDYGSSITLADTETFTVDFNASTGIFTLT